ncbi:MAG: DUF222 domain-containing protein, partial [Actinomycetota bacterium]|nr:DUF222 domain-containing protein [Actinomycetota bacterium]
MATHVHQVWLAGAYLADGHRTPKAWGRATCNWSGPEAARLVRLGAMLHRFPTAAGLAAEGRLGVAQMHALASVVANPRVRDHLDASEELLVGQATLLDFDDYVAFLAQWEALADQDGAHDSHERAHSHRRATAAVVGNQFLLDAFGGAANGAVMLEILNAFARSEWYADWEAGRGEHGDGMCPALMARTEAQRRFDALYAIFLKASAMDGDATGVAPTVNIIVSEELFHHHLEKMLGGQPDPVDPNNPNNRCETDTGVRIDPSDMLIAAAIGHVRRVVLDSASVVIDMGRKQRLFTGALRDAVML